MKSVRGHLLLHLGAALVMVSVIVGIFSYLSARQEIDELYDENLRQVALVIDGQEAVLSRSGHRASMSGKLKGEEEFLIQIWGADGRLVYSSHPKITYLKPEKSGFTTREFQGKPWRSYALLSDSHALQVSQSLDMRDEMTAEIALGILLPILLQFPIMGFFVWLAVGTSLESLSVLAGGIQKRSAQSLQSLPLDKVPEEIMPLVLALNDLLAKLEHSLQLQRKFTADAAHELRTPLTAVSLQLALLDRSKNEAEREDAMKTLTAGVDRSIRLVEQLLAFSRIEADTEHALADNVDLGRLVRDVLPLFARQAEAKGIDLGLCRDDPAVVSGNRDALVTVLGNLVENAVRYTPAGGRVDVSVYRDDHGHAVLSVADNGVGIPVAERARIFDRFYRIAGSAEQGTGLGLSIVRNIVDRHGAGISVGDGLDGRGASFAVVFAG